MELRAGEADMTRRNESRTWPYLLVLGCLFAHVATAPREWKDRAAGIGGGWPVAVVSLDAGLSRVKPRTSSQLDRQVPAPTPPRAVIAGESSPGADEPALPANALARSVV